MTSKKHRLIIYGVAVQLLLVAIVCYAAFPVEKPEEPIRLMYQTKTGKVLFDHQTHAGVNGYALACLDCHHLHDGEEIEPVACGLCHLPKPKPESATYPESCFDCHSDESELEDPNTPRRPDAFHKQCEQCHEQYGHGPGGGSDNCGKCHVL
ncbi:MAG: cytochrome c3 family protein [Desulfatitalea sp.]|nr:cytochrome c family protein [Desulfatitalea sp.]NNK02087.1 cytochrome c3 family protein [Desulfatitalea sp.]